MENGLRIVIAIALSITLFCIGNIICIKANKYEEEKNKRKYIICFIILFVISFLMIMVMAFVILMIKEICEGLWKQKIELGIMLVSVVKDKI